MSSDPERSEGPITLTLAEVFTMQQTLRRVRAVTAAHQVSVAMLMTLKTVAEHPQAPLSVNAQILGLARADMTNAINLIEKRGLVRRLTWREDGGSSDHRAVFVAVTARGQELLDALAVIEVEP